MTPIEKHKEIVEAIKNGVPKKRVNPENNGSLARRLIKGEKVADEKIEEMYKNLIEYRNNPNKYREINESYRDYLPQVSKEEKIQQIIQAVNSGVVKNHLDPTGVGDAVRKLRKGENVGAGKINEMYARLLALRQEKAIDLPGRKVESLNIENLINKIQEQNKEIETLKTKMASLQKQMKELAKGQEKENRKKQTIKVLGVSLVEKTDIVRGKKYKRWYGNFRENGKQRWIYIGIDITKAREKIRNYLEERRGVEQCT